MRNYSFVVQSGNALDAPSMKSVRSHVTREQMKKRRSQLEKQEAAKDESRSRKNGGAQPKPRRKAKEIKREIKVEVDDAVKEEDDEVATSSTASEESKAVVATPSAQLSGTTGEFNTLPYEKRRMMEFFNRYYEFVGLYSVQNTGIETDYSPFAGFLQQESFTNPAWLASIALVATQKLDTYRERETTDILKYKALALQALSKKISAPEVEEPTILAVAALYAYEVLNSDNNPEGEAAARAHHHGLLTYIKSKGGPGKFAEQSQPYGVFLVRATLTYEMIFAIRTGRDPQSVVVDMPKLRTFHSAEDGTREPYFVGGPLLWPSCTAGHGSPESLEALDNYSLFTKEVKTLLFDLFTATELLSMELYSDMDENAKTTLSILRKSIQLPAEPNINLGVVEKKVSTTARIARSCWLAGSIYLRAIVDMVPFTHTSNAEIVTELHHIIKNLDIQTWATIPYVHLWISMVGMAASVNQTQRRFFSVQTGRCGILFGSRWWDNYRQAVVNFLWLQKLLRGEVNPSGCILTPASSQAGDLDVNLDVPLQLHLDMFPLTPPDSLRDTLSPDTARPWT